MKRLLRGARAGTGRLAINLHWGKSLQSKVGVGSFSRSRRSRAPEAGHPGTIG